MLDHAPCYSDLRRKIELTRTGSGIVLMTANSRAALHALLTALERVTNEAALPNGEFPVLVLPEQRGGAAHDQSDICNTLWNRSHMLKPYLMDGSSEREIINALEAYGTHTVCCLYGSKLSERQITQWLTLVEGARALNFGLAVVLATTEDPKTIISRQPSLSYEAMAMSLEPLDDDLVEALLLAEGYTGDEKIMRTVVSMCCGNYGRLQKLIRLYAAEFNTKHLVSGDLRTLRNDLGW